MPSFKRNKTDYPGVYYIEGKQPRTGKPERIYYFYFRKDGKKIEQKAGRQFQDAMTPAKANVMRGECISGKRLTNKEKREVRKAEKEAAKQIQWTIDNLWKEYKAGRRKNSSLDIDILRYEKYLKPAFEKKKPKDIAPLDVEHLKRKLLKTKSPQTVKHVLNLLTWIINFGVNKGLCSGLSSKIEKPEVHNETTEDLTPDQLESLLKAIEEDKHPQAGLMMKLALYSGMRRGEMFKLQWKHIDFERGFIHIKDPKGGLDQKVPLNDLSREILESHLKTEDTPYVFPGRDGARRKTIQMSVNEIKEKAGLPKDFRPLHGLRHVFASMLASSGKVDLYTLQKLLTHKDSRMTQRYAHLRDEALRNASNVTTEVFRTFTKTETKKQIT